jgi:thiosulfate/3-mercaptopyruvate sulfurtransferase
MRRPILNHRRWPLVALLCFSLAGLAGQLSAAGGAMASDDPWKADELIEPADLARSLSAEPKPVVLQIGIVHLFRLAHIPGATYAGPASSPEGLEALRKAVKDLPRTREVVFYCGCCPMGDCPNIRPAYQALREMGFKRIRLLDLPKNFTQDWQTKGYPIEKGGA